MTVLISQLVRCNDFIMDTCIVKVKLLGQIKFVKISTTNLNRKDFVIEGNEQIVSRKRVIFYISLHFICVLALNAFEKSIDLDAEIQICDQEGIEIPEDIFGDIISQYKGCSSFHIKLRLDSDEELEFVTSIRICLVLFSG